MDLPSSTQYETVNLYYTQPNTRFIVKHIHPPCIWHHWTILTGFCTLNCVPEATLYLLTQGVQEEARKLMNFVQHYIQAKTWYSFLSVYSRVSFCDGSFYDDSLLRLLSSRTEHSLLLVHHCRNSSVLSLLSAILVLFRCAFASSFSILVQFY